MDNINVTHMKYITIPFLFWNITIEIDMDIWGKKQK